MLLLLLFPLAGCGQGSGEPSTPKELQAVAAAALIQKRDLPPGEVQTEPIPELCSPIPLLEEEGAKVVNTPLLRHKTGAVAEVIGLAPSVRAARQSLAELQGRNRLACVQASIESFGPQEGSSVKTGALEPVAEGDEGSRVQFAEVDSASKPINLITAVSLRSGRCLLTLLLARSGSQAIDLTERVLGRAYERLEDAHSICR